jgi:hypothetical protein
MLQGAKAGAGRGKLYYWRLFLAFHDLKLLQATSATALFGSYVILKNQSSSTSEQAKTMDTNSH